MCDCFCAFAHILTGGMSFQSPKSRWLTLGEVDPEGPVGGGRGGQGEVAAGVDGSVACTCNRMPQPPFTCSSRKGVLQQTPERQSQNVALHRFVFWNASKQF